MGIRILFLGNFIFVQDCSFELISIWNILCEFIVVIVVIISEINPLVISINIHVHILFVISSILFDLLVNHFIISRILYKVNLSAIRKVLVLVNNIPSLVNLEYLRFLIRCLGASMILLLQGVWKRYHQ